jgi:hypothetical protein
VLVLSVVVIKVDLVATLKGVARMFVAAMNSRLVVVLVVVAGVMASSSPA